MASRATAAPAAARVPAAAAPTFAVQRCSCGSGEKDAECEQCRSQAVQTSPLAGSPGAPPAAANGGAAGHALGALDIFYRSPDEEAGDRGGAVQRSAAVAPPPGREEAEEPEPGAAAPSVDGSLEPGDDGEAVAAIEAGQPFGSGAGSGGQAGAPGEDEALQTFSHGPPSAGPAAGRPVAAGAVRHRLAGGGRPLPGSLRRPMERFFGRDLSAVRVHADDRAGRLAGALSSEAFAVGEHVVFAAGAWRPAAAGGRALLAHELQHVLQQRAGLSGEIVRRGIGRPGDAWERAAEAAAREFSRRDAREGGPAEATPAGGRPDGALHRLLAHALPHVVQQRVGAQLRDGAGEANDTYERHADKAARRVAEGQSAAPLLMAYQSAPDAGRASKAVVQRQEAEHGFGDAYRAAPDATYVAAHGPKDLVSHLKSATGTGSLVDVNVEDFGDMLSAARDKKTGVMHIVGSGLAYFKNHEVTEGIRQGFIEMLRQSILGSKGNSGTLKGTYTAGLTVYGGRMWDFSVENLFSKGTWMIGKNDQPTIEYELSYSRIALEAWSADWKAAWRIRDNFDLKGGTDQTSFYNRVAKPAGWLWHDVLGGKTPAPVNIDWHESGKLRVGPPLKSTGTKTRTLRPGDVRQW